MAIIALALISASSALWLAVWLSRPRLPAPFNETAWLVYSRLLGNHENIRLWAILFSGLAFYFAVFTFVP